MRSESTLKARKPMKGICRPGVAEVSQWEIHDILGESIWNMFHFGVPIRKSQVERRTGWDRSSHWGPNLVYKPWLEIHYSYKPVCGYFYTLCILYLISRNTYKSWLKSNNEPGVGVFGEDFPENIEPGLLWRRSTYAWPQEGRSWFRVKIWHHFLVNFEPYPLVN